MRYTQKQRNEIYKDAYKLIESQLEDFVCNAIQKIIYSRVSINEENFPELFLFRNRITDYVFLSNKGFDANTHDFTHKKIVTRKLWVLAFCIAMTE